MAKRYSNSEAKDRIRRRVSASYDGKKYRHFPERKPIDYYDNDVYQRVAVYVRVSTDDPRQTTSYELQKKYYEEFVVRHPKWELVDIYADEGISGTSLKHRDAFNRMIDDAKAGKIDLIITKSVSRFARNVFDFLGMIRMLSERHPRIGVFFEAENIFSLNETSAMALSFQATMAEEESRNKSRSMETSLRMRLDHGLPLTPKLLGFTHDEEGHLIINQETAHIPKLMFYMYLFGFSTQQIADALTVLGKETYLGNAKWTAGGVVQTLRNERYCGDVFTRKTYTPDVLSHRSVKNRGERPRTHYYDEHEAIISRDDFIAVQRMLDNSKYGNTSMLPELRVITQGLLKGFVIINPRWGGFKEAEYRAASASAYQNEPIPVFHTDVEVTAQAGDFDLRGFEIAQLDFFSSKGTPFVSFADKQIKFSAECVRRIKSDIYVELLVHPYERRFAVRPTTKDNRNAVRWADIVMGQKEPRLIPCAAFFDTLYALFGWSINNKYRIYGGLYQEGDAEAYIFTTYNAGVYVNSRLVPNKVVNSACDEQVLPLQKLGKRIGVVSAETSESFGKDFYLGKTLMDVSRQTKEEWQLRIEGQLYSSGKQLQVTDYEELKRFIIEQLDGKWPKEDAVNE